MSLPEDLVRDLNEVAGSRKRSAFAEEALRRAIKRAKSRIAAEKTSVSLDMRYCPHWWTSQDVLKLEYLRGARELAEHEASEGSLRAYPWLRIEPADWDRALHLTGPLAQVSAAFHRSVPIPDLLIAAVAERNAVLLVHDDADHERIAGITGQETMRISGGSPAT